LHEKRPAFTFVGCDLWKLAFYTIPRLAVNENIYHVKIFGPSDPRRAFALTTPISLVTRGDDAAQLFVQLLTGSGEVRWGAKTGEGREDREERGAPGRN